jgi:hypothetical protein
MEADSRVEIQIKVERWHLRYSWGIGEPVDSLVLPAQMRHGPRFLNALELEVFGSAVLQLAEPHAVSAHMTIEEIDGPEPPAHDAERAQEFGGVGRVELETALRVSSGLTRGALLALHYTLAHAETPQVDLLCRKFERTGLGKGESSDLIRFSAGPAWPAV